MNLLFRIAKLTYLIILEGKFRGSAYDFQNVRGKALEDLARFCPAHERKMDKKRPSNSPLIGYWLGQIAFIRRAFKKIGGHLCAPALNLCYIRNPKSASTALAYAMLTVHYPELKNYTVTPAKINFLADVNLNRELSAGDRKAVFFTVIRNPFVRIVSVYRKFFERQSGHFIYQDYLFGIFRKDHSFKQFLNILHLIPDGLMDQHLRPQHNFVTFYERRGIAVKILKLEKPDAIEEFLLPYGLPFKPLNKSDAYDYRAYFDEEALDLVYELYKEDIRRFDYGAAVQELRRWIGAQTV